MPIKQTQRELDKEAEAYWDKLDTKLKCHWIDMLNTCLLNDAPEEWRRYIIQRGTGARPTYLALYLWNRHAEPSKQYDVSKLLENENSWPGLSSDFCKKLCRVTPLEPLGVDVSIDLTNPIKENTMNQFNETAVAAPKLIFGRVADNMTEADFLHALEKLQSRKDTLVKAQEIGSSEYLSNQVKQVNDEISEVLDTMDKVLG